VSDPSNKYDIIAIGGGAGGLVTSIGSVIYGAPKVGLIERSLMGGDCLNTGCIPSKAFLRSAMVAH
jgi:pyruvate/2-oxoglutarate dehydrogenase complex dihydrolipoamide dehydrogenase (E3) component